MKKLIAVLAVMFSIDAAAFTGTGNDHIDDAREYMRRVAGGADIDFVAASWWLGAVSGLSEVFSQEYYEHSVCYPEESNAGQLAEIAARFHIDHPEELAESFWFRVCQSHAIAFGFRDDENCWMNTEE
jgi:hypothetical protein